MLPNENNNNDKNKWKFCGYENPPQGLKILCMKKGDFFVAQRLGKYWFTIPFYSCEFSSYDEPDLWQYIDFPHGYHGYMHVQIDGKLLKVDELEKYYPREYQELVKSLKKSFDEKKRPVQ